MNAELEDLLVKSNSPEQILSNVISQKLKFKRLGWFNFKEGIDFYYVNEDFQMLKIYLNYVKFLSRFFDNYKTNLYKKIIQEYKKRFGKNIFHFFFTSFTSVFIFFNNQRRIWAPFIIYKVAFNSNNKTVIKVFQEYVLDVKDMAKNLTSSFKKLGPKDFQLINYLLSDDLNNIMNPELKVKLIYSNFDKNNIAFLKNLVQCRSWLDSLKQILFFRKNFLEIKK